MKDSELVSAIRVAELCLSRCDLGSPEHNVWLKVRQALETNLRLQSAFRPPLSSKEVAAAREVIRVVASVSGTYSSVLERGLLRLGKERNFLGKLRKIQIRRGTPHRIS